jgi:hypothetical protein
LKSNQDYQLHHHHLEPALADIMESPAIATLTGQKSQENCHTSVREEVKCHEMGQHHELINVTMYVNRTKIQDHHQHTDLTDLRSLHENRHRVVGLAKDLVKSGEKGQRKFRAMFTGNVLETVKYESHLVRVVEATIKTSLLNILAAVVSQ